MRSRKIGIRIALALPFIIGSLAADPVAQPQISFTSGSSNTWNADWAGITQRTYFMQWSLDLVTWNYAPVVEFSTGAKHYGINTVIPPSTASAPKLFIRLKCVDDVGVTTLQQARAADFDGDGIPNSFEVETVGSDPLDRTSAGGDLDGDGLPDGWEKYFFGGIGIANPNTASQPDGLTNKEKAELGLDPNVDYSNASASQTARFDYDLAGRLTSVTAPVGSATYSPDPEGNILNAQ